MEHPSHPVESHWRTSLRNRIIQASSLLEVLLSGLVDVYKRQLQNKP